MKTRREFLKRTAAGGIAGIFASGVAPAYSKERSVIHEIIKEKPFEDFSVKKPWKFLTFHGFFYLAEEA